MNSPNPDLVLGDDGKLRSRWAMSSPEMMQYYDNEWGYPVFGEQAWFERISLETFQAGLSWATVLKKRPALRESFADFDPDKVAKFSEQKISELLENSALIRNQAKIYATVTNAQATIRLREIGGLEGLIKSHSPIKPIPAPHTQADVPTESAESAALAAALKKHGFKFVGPTTMFSLMEATGLVNTHLVGSWRRPV